MFSILSIFFYLVVTDFKCINFNRDNFKLLKHQQLLINIYKGPKDTKLEYGIEMALFPYYYSTALDCYNDKCLSSFESSCLKKDGRTEEDHFINTRDKRDHIYSSAIDTDILLKTQKNSAENVFYLLF